MKVFISWSGQQSKFVAVALRQWLPEVIQLIKPWMSESDIEAGARWGREIGDELQKTNFGIICLTKDNQLAPWLLFEAGALAKTVADTFVCPYLIGLDPTDIAQGPLTQFQAKRASEVETWELICSINNALKENRLPEERLRRIYERAWPDLDNKLKSLPVGSKILQPVRSVENTINEVLELVRSLTRSTPVEIRVDALSRDIQFTNNALTSLLARTQLSDTQGRINYEFSRVDFKVIEALKGVLDNFKAIAATPTIARHIEDVDFEKIEAAIQDAYRTSAAVADIRPPGSSAPDI